MAMKIELNGKFEVECTGVWGYKEYRDPDGEEEEEYFTSDEEEREEVKSYWFFEFDAVSRMKVEGYMAEVEEGWEGIKVNGEVLEWRDTEMDMDNCIFRGFWSLEKGRYVATPAEE